MVRHEIQHLSDPVLAREDTRARLAVLSEVPDDWTQQVQIWSRLLRARRGDIEGTAPPDRNDEYLFYQLLIGTWPAELLGIELDGATLQAYTERLKDAMVKSIREAKVHSTWAVPDPVYEEAILSFATNALDPLRAGNFLASFQPFVERIAKLGARNTLVQTVLRLTLPGMPDIYQGAELWDFSIVDPDNRRPVDYPLRAQMLDRVLTDLATDRRGAMQRYIESWRDGHLKLAAIATILGYRREHAALFENGEYEPLRADGPKNDRICAFLRCRGEEVLLTAVARFPARPRRP